MSLLNRKVVLKSRPQGMPRPQDFEIVASVVPDPGPGEVLIRHHVLGLAPAARLRMAETKSYAKTMAFGDVVHAGAVGEIVASRHAGFTVGDAVASLYGGMQEYSVSSGMGVSVIDTSLAPPTAWLGPLGVSGESAWIGLNIVGVLEPKSTVVVSAATGSVGAMVGQIAKLRGCRVVGVAGGPVKCRQAVQEYGFDACVDYRSSVFVELLRAACPTGADVYFDNVGGEVRDAVWPLLNEFGRVVVCGLIAEYNDAIGPGPGWFQVLAKRLTVRGFIVTDHADLHSAFLSEVGSWYRAGRIFMREDIVDGLEQAVPAFIGMLQGKNIGKSLVRLDQSDARHSAG